MKRNFFLTLFSLLIALIATKANENNSGLQNIRGKVLDEVTGYPLPGASVIVMDFSPAIGTTSDLNGEFVIPNIPIGRRTVKISFIGYKPQVLSNLLLVSGKELALEISLTEDVTTVEEVVVKAERISDAPLNEMAMVSAGRFNIEQTERYAGSLGDPARMAANYAGVVTNNDSRNDIIIRGNSPAGLLWRLEGVEIPNPNHFGASGTTGGPVSMLNNNMLSNSDFFTGAFPAEYGNALSGAFDLNMRSGNNRKHEFTGQIGFNGFEAGAEGPLFSTGNGQKASYMASFRYSTLQLVSKMGLDMGTGTAIPEYKDLTYIVDIPGTALGRLKFFGIYGDSFISFGRNLNDSDESAYNGRGTATDFGAGLNVHGMSHTLFLNENTRIKSTVSYQRSNSSTLYDSVKYNAADKSYFIQPFFNGRESEQKISYSSQLKYKASARNNFSLGFVIDNYLVDKNDSIYRSHIDEYETVSDMESKMALYRFYGQWHHSFSDELSVYSGLYTQKLSLNSEITLEPRLGLKYQPVPQHTFSLGFGVHSMMQSKSTYMLEAKDEATGLYHATNLDVKFTRANHYVVGHKYLINEGWSLKSEAYYQNLYRVPVSKSFPEFSLLNAGASFGQVTLDSLENTGTGENYGMEFTLEKLMNKGMYALFTASVYNSTYQGYDKVVRNTTFNGNYTFNLLAGYEYEISEALMLTFDVRSVLAGGKRYIPIDVEASKQQSKLVYDYSKAYEKRYADYFRTDLRIGLKHNGKRFTQEWGLDLQNITNYQSIYLEDFDVDKNEVYSITQTGLMPMMLYRIQF